jgi:hypothetical protein
VRLTTERKVCAGVLALAVVALGVDRLFLGGATGPASASAAPVDPVLADPAVPGDAAPRAPIMGSTVPVAKQLAALETVARDIDGFAPPSRWQKALADAQAAEAARGTAKPEVAEGTDPDVKRFMRHQLTAVLRSGSRPVGALIKVADETAGHSSSRVVRVGEELDGFTMTDLDETTAKFADTATLSKSVDLGLAMGDRPATATPGATGPDNRP